MAKRSDEVGDVLDDMLAGSKPTPVRAGSDPDPDEDDGKVHIIQVRVRHSDYLKGKAMFARDGQSFSGGLRSLLARYVRGDL